MPSGHLEIRGKEVDSNQSGSFAFRIRFGKENVKFIIYHNESLLSLLFRLLPLINISLLARVGANTEKLKTYFRYYLFSSSKAFVFPQTFRTEKLSLMNSVPSEVVVMYTRDGAY